MRDRTGNSGVLVALLGVSAALFFVASVVTEGFGELALDVDFKLFFLLYVLLAAVPYGLATLSVAIGGAMGEGAYDVIEGYELDDPFGFVGYVLGFVTFGWILHQVAPDPSDRRWQALAAVTGALIQATFEGVAFLILGDVNVGGAVLSVLGNTVTHGVVLGAVPLVVCYPVLNERIARYVGLRSARPDRPTL
jgi:hypothetical protein